MFNPPRWLIRSLLYASLAATPALPAAPADADDDGLPDAWEQVHNLNPAAAADALLDTDGDGIVNLLELSRRESR